MLEIILIRPGSTDFDLQGRIQGTLDIPLNEEGNRKVAEVTAELKQRGIEVVYTSESEPALETAETIAAGVGVKCKKLDEMENVDLGLWQGMMIEEVRRKQPTVYRQWEDTPENICPPDGEMLGQAKERVQRALHKLSRKHKSGVIALVVPEPLASLVHCYLTHHALNNLWKAHDNGTWEAIHVEPQSLAYSR